MAEDNNMLTFGGHLEVLRKMFIRILVVAGVLAVVIFCFKTEVFTFLLAPSEWDFCTYRWIEGSVRVFGMDFHFGKYHVD